MNEIAVIGEMLHYAMNNYPEKSFQWVIHPSSLVILEGDHRYVPAEHKSQLSMLVYPITLSANEANDSLLLISLDRKIEIIGGLPITVVRHPRVLSFEQYAAEHDASRQDIGDAALHKSSSNVSRTARRSQLALQQERDQELLRKRALLRIEYAQKVEAGEIRPPTHLEQLKERAQGNPENSSVRAARRILEKMGYSYEEGASVDDKPKTQNQTINSMLKKANEHLDHEFQWFISNECLPAFMRDDRYKIRIQHGITFRWLVYHINIPLGIGAYILSLVSEDGSIEITGELPHDDQ